MPFFRWVIYFFVTLNTSVTFRAAAQLYPIQVTPQLVPPYSVYLSDYATPGNEKLRVIILQRDLSQPAYQLRLVMVVSLNGKVIMRTSRAFNPMPLSISPGIPTVVSGADLAPYLDSRNIEFVGYSREQYERTRALPEGSYQITFLAYDYRRPDVQVSNEGVSFYYLAKNEPPLINYPPCGTKIPLLNPQQIVFSWLPRNTSSPNSAAETEYEFSLYEVRPAGRNPNDVVMTTPPVFRTRLDFTQLVYGPAEPLLLEGMQYVWRVQALDKNGKDAFRNNGFSEVCTFTYGGTDATYDIGRVKNLQAEGETERRAKIFWETGAYDECNIFYKKTGTGYEWINSKVTANELKLFDLEPDTEYETRVQVKKGTVWGAYSDIVVFRTLPQRVAQCGDEQPTFNTTPGPPLAYATTGMIINARGMDMQLLEVQHLGENGWYKGIGRVGIDYLGGASFMAKFDRIYIDDNRNVVLGRIDLVSKGVATMIEQQLAGQRGRQEEKQQQENQDAWAGTDFYEKIFLFDNLVIGDVTPGTDSYITITDSQGTTTANAEVMQVLNTYPEKAIIIEDKNGDQWVVQKDKDTGATKVSKVSGGGLSSGNSTTQEAQDLNVIKEKILTIILEDFKEEITAWLRINGKGGEDDLDVLLALALPECFPKDADRLRHINERTIPYFENHRSELQQQIEADQSNKELLDRVGKTFLGKDVVWSEVSEEDQKSTREATCKAVLRYLSENFAMEESETGETIALDTQAPEYTLCFTPAGKVYALPKDTKFNFTNTTNVPVAKGALTSYYLRDAWYLAHYEKRNGKWYFDGYFKQGGGGRGSSYLTKEQLEAKLANEDLSITTASFGAATLILTPEQVLRMPTLSPAAATKLTNVGKFTVVSVAAGVVLELFVSTSSLEYGVGKVVVELPLPNIIVPTTWELPDGIPINLPITAPVAIPHKLPKDNGDCSVYVIFSIDKTTGAFAIAKYGITCVTNDDGSQCDTRPESQCVYFNSTPPDNLKFTYRWAWIPFAQNVSKSTALLVERSLTGVYIIQNGGLLPSKHSLPCFKKVNDWSDIDALGERLQRVREYLNQMKNTYGAN